MTDTLLIGLIGTILASNGLLGTLLMWKLRKNDKVEKLITYNNTQGEELVVLSGTMEGVLRVLMLLVDALHAKGVLNGNAKVINDELKQSTDSLHDYTKRQKDKAMFIVEAIAKKKY